LNVSLSGATRVVGLFGYPVGHSRSPAMQNAAFQARGLDCVYVPFNVHPEQLPEAVEAIRSLGMVGVNLTIPHKQNVIELLDMVNEDARQIGSVNTIVNVGGVLEGYSTDGQGFIRALKEAWKSPEGRKVVVLGAGGTARATVFALIKSGAEVAIANRTISRAEELAEAVYKNFAGLRITAMTLESAAARYSIKNADLVVNCTSVGMFPNVDAQPIPMDYLHPKLFVYDQIYNPWETRLLAAAKRLGCGVANGAGMLVHQGAIAFELWTGQTAPVEAMWETMRE